MLYINFAELPIKISLPSLLVSSLLMTKLSGELSNNAATMPADYYDNHLHQQIVFLDYFVNKFRQDSNYRSRELHIKSSRSGTSYLDQQVVDETGAKKDYSPNTDYHNEVNFHDFRKKLPCNGGILFLLENRPSPQAISLYAFNSSKTNTTILSSIACSLQAKVRKRSHGNLCQGKRKPALFWAQSALLSLNYV